MRTPRCFLELSNSQFNAIFPTSSTFLSGPKLSKKQRGRGSKAREPRPGPLAAGPLKALSLPEPRGGTTRRPGKGCLESCSRAAPDTPRPSGVRGWGPTCQHTDSAAVVPKGTRRALKNAHAAPLRRSRTTGRRKGHTKPDSPFLLFSVLALFTDPPYYPVGIL